MDWREDLNLRLIIDNGSNTLRFGSCTEQQPFKMLNLIGQDRKSMTNQIYYGEQLANILDESRLNYKKPHIKGVVVDWDTQVELWEKLLAKREPKNSSVAITSHPGLPNKVRHRMLELVFDYFAFDAFYPALSQTMMREYYLSQAQKEGCKEQQNPQRSIFQLIVESTHSATYLVPFFDGEVLNYAIRRLDVGGKLLTKHLMNLITTRYIRLKNDVRMAQQIKEEMCYVSHEFQEDMRAKPGSHAKYFILPEYETGKRGFVVDHYDEYLGENGLVQSVIDTLQNINADIRDYFYENVLLAGGNTLFSGLAQRLQTQLRANTPEYVNTRVTHVTDIDAVFNGAQDFCSYDEFPQFAIDKQLYKEQGAERLSKLFFY